MSEQNNILSTPNRRKSTQLCHVNLLKPYYVREPGPLSGVAATGGGALTSGVDDGVAAPDDGLLRGRLKNNESLRNLKVGQAHLV